MIDKKLSVLEQNADKFNGWITTINKYNSTTSSKRELADETVDVLAQISELFFKYGTFKDTFDNTKFHPHIYGVELSIVSAKTNTKYDLGIDDKGIYLETLMKHSENLRHMDDSFYKDILTLLDLGDFDIQETQSYSSQTTRKYSLLYNNQKSKIFRILRNYIIGTAENESEVHLGRFHIHWTRDTDFYDLIQNSCVAFRTLYKLNYSLWKIHDLQTKKK